MENEEKNQKEGEGIKSLVGKQACWEEKVNTVSAASYKASS